MVELDSNGFQMLICKLVLVMRCTSSLESTKLSVVASNSWLLCRLLIVFLHINGGKIIVMVNNKFYLNLDVVKIQYQWKYPLIVMKQFLNN